MDTWFLLQMGLHSQAIGLFVALDPGAPNRRTFGGIEQSELNAGLVRQTAHKATQGVDLFDQVAFGQPPYGGVAGHVGNGVQIQIKNQDLQTHTGGRQSAFTAGVPGSHHNEIIGFRIECHGWLIIWLK